MPSEKDVSVILITDDDESGIETRKKKKSKAGIINSKDTLYFPFPSEPS